MSKSWHHCCVQEGTLLTFQRYQHHEQVQYGDWNWIVPGRFLAMASPSSYHPSETKFSYLPADYLPYFKQHKIEALIRLNEIIYEKHPFEDNGNELRHN